MRKAAAMPARARRVVRLNNGFQLLFNLLWWMPVFYEYQRQAGLSDGQIFGIQSIYYAAFCLLELPTGLIADRMGQRRSMQLGAAVMTAANLIPVAAPGAAGFLAHFLAVATARSLVSGAASAYLYESLHAHGAGEHYAQAEGTARALGLWAKIACWPLVGVLMHLLHAAPYVLTALSAAGGLVCALALPPLPAHPGACCESPVCGMAPCTHARRVVGPQRSPLRFRPSALRSHAPDAIPHRPGGRNDATSATGPSPPPAARERTGLRDAVRQSASVLRSSKPLGPLMVQGVGLFTLARICQVNLFQPLLLAKAVPVAEHGAVLSAMTVAEAVGSARPSWVRSRLSDTAAVTVLSLVMALSLAATTAGGALGTIGLLCVFAAATGLAFPIQKMLVNSAIPPTPYRTTLLSVESIIDRGVCALVALAVGAFLAAGRLDALLLYAALGTCLLLAAVGVVLRLLRRNGHREPVSPVEADRARAGRP